MIVPIRFCLSFGLRHRSTTNSANSFFSMSGMKKTHEYGSSKDCKYGMYAINVEKSSPNCSELRNV